MSVIEMRSGLALAITVLVMGAGLAPRAAAGADLIKVEWNDPEIQSFVSARAAGPARSFGASADEKLANVQVPVLAFEATPGVVENTFRGASPAAERDVVVDEQNPVWYQLVERYGDMTVSVEADLRVQHEVPESYPVYGAERRGGAEAGPEVSVFDEHNEDGVEEGLIAEYTIEKFGVPYKVTIECSASAKEQCRDTGQIAKDSELLKLVRANPPPQ